MFFSRDDLSSARQAQPESIRDIVASVRQKADHLSAENKLAELRNRRAANREEFLRLIAGVDDRDSQKTQVKRLEAERIDIEEKLGQARLAVRPLRQRHLEAVTKAVAKRRMAEGTRLLEALSAARSALGALQEIEEELHRAFGPIPSIVRNAFGPEELVARQAMAGEA